MGGRSPEAPPKITLKFGSSKSSSAAGVSVDNESLKRQQDLVKAGSNSQESNASKPSQEKPENLTDNGVIPNGIKREASHGHSPALSANQTNGATTSTMLPPPVQLASGAHIGSPNPQAAAVNGISSAGHHANATYISHLRQEGKGMNHCDPTYHH